VLMPRARTRMTMQGPTGVIFKQPETGFDTFAPEHVVPLVAWLCTPRAARVSGQVFVVFGREIKVIDHPEPSGIFRVDDVWTLESVDARLAPWFEKREPVKDGFTVPPA